MDEELGETWNYRVMIGFDESLSIRTVFYNEDGLITHWTMSPSEMIGHHVSELWENYQEMGKAFDFPIMMERDLENQFLEADRVALPLEDNDE
jgi:hypothetical protein